MLPLHVLITEDLNEELEDIKKVTSNKYGFKLFKNHFIRIATKELLDKVKENPKELEDILKKYNYL